MSVTHLSSEHVSPQTVLTELQSRVNDIDEIFVVYRRKSDRLSYRLYCGTLSGLSFSILLLQRLAFKVLDGE